MAKEPKKRGRPPKKDTHARVLEAMGDKAPVLNIPNPAIMGRPTVYRPEMCDQVIEWGKQGKSRTWIAAHLGVCRETLWDWEQKIPDFSNAIKLADHFSQVWWEDAGQNGMLMPGFNAGIWTKNMTARFTKEWREVKAAEITGADGGAIKIDVQRVDLSNMPAKVLDALEHALEMIESPEEEADVNVIDGEAEE